MKNFTEWLGETEQDKKTEKPKDKKTIEKKPDRPDHNCFGESQENIENNDT